MKRLRAWYGRQDEHEKSAIVSFGIGGIIGVGLFYAFLFIVRSVVG